MPTDLVVLCCVCGKLKITREFWIETSEKYTNQKVSHGYCPECAYWLRYEMHIIHLVLGLPIQPPPVPPALEKTEQLLVPTLAT
jgi:hypothetical protein